MNLRWVDMLISVSLALVMWFVLSGTGKSVGTFDVRLEYRGLPQNMVITNQLVNSISVRVSGSAGLMRTFNNRNHVYPVDLSSITRGENRINISKDKLPFRGATDITVVDSAQILVVADSVENKVVPLILKLRGDAPMDYTVSADTTVSTVTVRGAASVIKSIKHIDLSVEIPEQLSIGSKQITKVLPFPDGITLKPSEINVTLYTDISRQKVKVTRNIVVDHTSGLKGTVSPQNVKIELEMPNSTAHNAADNDEIIAFVKVKSGSLTNGKVAVQVTLPKLAKLVHIEPDMVEFVPAEK